LQRQIATRHRGTGNVNFLMSFLLETLGDIMACRNDLFPAAERTPWPGQGPMYTSLFESWSPMRVPVFEESGFFTALLVVQGQVGSGPWINPCSH
jgi:hypothetical protein